MSSGDIVSPRFEDSAELNAWARHIAQTYITWYTGFFAFNAVALGYITLASKSPQAHEKAFVTLFVIFNLLGVCSTSSIALYGWSVHKKLKTSADRLSPFPLALWLAITTICVVSLVVMAIIWMYVPGIYVANA